jgi:hypothetical protein
MRILLDTNILIDYLLKRVLFKNSAVSYFWRPAWLMKVSGCIAAHSISILFFILRNPFRLMERRDI